MAGILGAIFPNPAFVGNFPLFSPNYPSSKSFKPLSNCNYARSPYQKICPFILEMAQTVANHSPEIKEPNPKIPKLHQNGDSEAPHEITSFLRVKKLSENAVLPSRASPLSAGYDLSSAIETKVPARGKALIPADLSIAIPDGTYARIAPRSGLAWKHSIDVGAGVIDADYRGPVGVILFNHSDVDFEVKAGDRIAQLIIEKISTPEVTEVDDLDSTIWGSGGFGSTGCLSTQKPKLAYYKLAKHALREAIIKQHGECNHAIDITVPARGKAKVPTHLIIDIPQGAYGRIAGRSGLAWEHSIDVGGGVLDADKNPVFVILYNHSNVDFDVKVGDEIAQMVMPEIWKIHQ